MAKPLGVRLDIDLGKQPAADAVGIGIAGSRVTTPLELSKAVSARQLTDVLGSSGRHFKPDSNRFKPNLSAAAIPASGDHAIGRVSLMLESMRTDGNHGPRPDSKLEAALFGPRSDQPIRFAQLGAADAAASSTPMGFRRDMDVSSVSSKEQSSWGRWVPDPRMGYEPPSHWHRPDSPSVGGQPASYRAFAAAPIDAGDVTEFVQALGRFGASAQSGGAAPAQVLQALKAGDYRTLDNGHAYIEFNHGLRGRSGASNAQLFVFGLEIKPAAIAPIREQLEAAGQ